MPARPLLLAMMSTVCACGPKPAPVAVAQPEPEAPPEPEPEAGPAPGPAALATPRPLLVWEVRKGDVLSHLLGTCHVPIPLEHALPAPLEDHLRGARVLVSELDLAEVLSPEKALALTWDPEVDLVEALGADDFTALSVHVRDQLPASMLVHTPPWVVIALPQGPPDGRALDQLVADVAAEAGVEPLYLETADEQVAMLDAISDAILPLLRASDPASQDWSAGMDAVVGSCLTGELGAIEDLLDDPEDESGRVMFDVRNAAWAPRVIDQAEQGGAFVAVGAGHMLGETGLVAQLERAGFTVTRLETDVPGVPDLAVAKARAPLRPAEVDPGLVSGWMEALAPAVGTLCAEGQVVGTCYLPEPEACQARMARDLELCVEQLASKLPAQPDDASVQQVVACAVTGVGIEDMVVAPEPRAELCATTRAAMLEAMRAAMP